MVNRRGTSTNTAYISSAGKTNSQPTMVSRRTPLCRKVRRGAAERQGGCLAIIVDVTVDLAGAGIVVAAPIY